MSVLSPKRVILFVAATLLALPLFATNPSPRYAPRMAFDESSGIGILFGGRGLDDKATGLIHGSDETWAWVRNQWVQQFPAVNPPARSDHAMVYDSKRDRIIMFGGRKEATVVRQKVGVHGDTWAWHNSEWQDLAPAHAPSARYFPGMAYDRDRDKVVLFGGYNYNTDGKTIESRFDTWEFDGNDWSRVNENGPDVSKALLVFDAARHETLLVGVDKDFKAVMQRWDSASSSWKAITPSLLPACVNESQLVYRTETQRPFLSGGVCAGTDFLQDSYEWDGTTWVKLETSESTEVVNAAATYDTLRNQVVVFGGYPTFQTTPDSTTYVLRSLTWRGVATTAEPGPRSMPVFRRDPERDVTWLFGGLNEHSIGDVAEYLSDLWQYSDGAWVPRNVEASAPFGCVTPLGVLDTNRNVLVVVCNGSVPYEWNGETWKSFTNLSQTPADRRFAGATYDENLKKLVMFGGYDTFGNYRQDTWTWDGTAWTEIKPKTKPPHRAQPVMWYDPLAKKTIIYSGAGRKSIEDHATRYSDMWSFNGTDWTLMNVTTTPGIRFAPQVAVDPNSGKLYLFGGLRATLDAADSDRVTQFYDNDMWVWDGSSSTWTQLHPDRLPPARQNAGFEFDPASGKLVLFGGTAGNLYKSDRWEWDGQNWTPMPNAAAFRRRSTRP
jgi:N-acetylneuraminic acid mutarotase